MEQADFAENHFDNRFGADKSVFAKFYFMPVKDEHASAEQGRPIFNDVEFVEIIVAGDATNQIQRQATDQDRQRFRAAYGNFKDGNAEALVGTPLTEVTWLGKSQVEELSYLKVRTLEALAELNDTVCGKYPGFYDLKRRAMAHMLASEKAAPLEAVHAENQLLKQQLEALMVTVNDQTQMLKELKDKK